jgi:hypothetical protein
MKVSPHLYAIMAFGALSTDVAIAGHYHRYLTKADTAASYSGTNARGLAKVTAMGGQQGSGPGTAGGALDHVNADAADKGTADKSAPRSKTPPNAALSRDNGNGAISVDVHGIHDIVVPGGGTPETGPNSAIDIRVTTFRGRGAHTSVTMLSGIIKSKDRPSIYSSISFGSASDVNHHYARDDHQKFPVATSGGWARNAIGAMLGRRATTLKTNSKPAATTTVAVSTDQIAISKGENGPIYNTEAGIERGRHKFSAGAVAIAAPNTLSVNGAGLGHLWLRNGVIGGPAKIAAVLNGTPFGTRHP